MTSITNELIFEVLKKIQEDVSQTKSGVRDMHVQLQAMREHMQAQSREIGNIYDKFAQHDLRLERIERRLDLISEPAH